MGHKKDEKTDNIDPILPGPAIDAAIPTTTDTLDSTAPEEDSADKDLAETRETAAALSHPESDRGPH